MQATSDILAKVKLIVEGNAEYGDGILLSLTAFLQGENFGSKKTNFSSCYNSGYDMPFTRILTFECFVKRTVS